MNSLNRTQTSSSSDGFRGFTLAEMLIAMGVFTMVIGAMVSLQLFGMRVYTLAATKLSATTGGRTVLNQIRDQIRSGKMVYVGNCTTTNYSSFQLISTNNYQVGNALIVYPTTDVTSCVIFYLDTSGGTNYLMQFNVSNTITSTSTNSKTTYIKSLAGYITNISVFDLEDWQTNIAKSENALDNRLLIRVTLQFYQWEYPIAQVGTNSGLWNAYDYYQLRTRVFRRAWN